MRRPGRMSDQEHARLRREAEQHDLALLTQEAQHRKAMAEAAILENQLTTGFRRIEFLKALSGVSGLVLALAGVFGGTFSAVKWFDEQSQEREIRTEERLDRALNGLASERANQRLAAIGSLRSFVGKGQSERDAQVLLSIANAVAVEDDDTVRGALVSFYRKLDDEGVKVKSMKPALISLINSDRNIMDKNNIWLDRPENLYLLRDNEKYGDKLQDITNSIVHLLRSGAKYPDMTSIYLGNSDLSNLNLDSVNFNDSIVAWSNFSGASLVRASFNGADLERTNFHGANLPNANLRFDDDPSIRRHSYVSAAMNRGSGQVYISMPDFTCANLTNSDFSGHPLFGIYANDLPDLLISVYPARFDGANLRGANLSSVSIFTLSRANDDRLPITPEEGGGSSLFNGSEYFENTYKTNFQSRTIPEYMPLFSKSLDAIGEFMGRADWTAAKWSPGLKELIASSVPDTRNRPPLSC